MGVPFKGIHSLSPGHVASKEACRCRSRQAEHPNRSPLLRIAALPRTDVPRPPRALTSGSAERRDAVAHVDQAVAGPHRGVESDPGSWTSKSRCGRLARDHDRYRVGTGVLDDVLDRLEAAVVHRDLDILRVPRLARTTLRRPCPARLHPRARSGQESRVPRCLCSQTSAPVSRPPVPRRRGLDRQPVKAVPPPNSRW